MSYQVLHDILASTARLETIAEATQRELTTLREETTARLNAHATDLRSLNKTRDKVMGGAKLGSVVVVLVMAVLGWLRYYD